MLDKFLVKLLGNIFILYRFFIFIFIVVLGFRF